MSVWPSVCVCLCLSVSAALTATLSASAGGLATKQIIYTDKAPAAIGPYSQAVLVDGTLYISGEIGLDAATGQLQEGVEAQAQQAMENMGYILEAANMTFSDVVKATVLLADINDFTKVNDVYETFFTEDYPARAAFQVAALPKAALVEIQAVAVQST